MAENESIDSWKILFKSIYNQRESIRYKLGTPAERKAINRMMKKKNPELLELMADVAEREDAKDVINNVNVVIAQIEHDAYIKMLGAYVESHIQKFLIEALEPIGIFVNNEQCGQDFILSKQGYEDYHVEVKSRWENDQSVEMSSTQFRCAVDMPDRYALISVNMYKFDRSRAEKIIQWKCPRYMIISSALIISAHLKQTCANVQTRHLREGNKIYDWTVHTRCACLKTYSRLIHSTSTDY